MQRLQADRQGQVVHPRGTPTSGQQDTLPGMTQVTGPTPRPSPVQLPPITSLLGTRVVEPVAQAGGDARPTETTLPVDTPVATETPTGGAPATNEQGQESRTGPTPTTTPAADQAGQETTPSNEQVTMTVDVEPPPVAQEPEQTAMDTQPVDQPQPVSTVPEEPVAQTPTPVVTRPRRKRRGSTTSAPGDLNPESGSDTATDKIYHSAWYDHGLVNQWFCRPRASIKADTTEPSADGRLPQLDGCGRGANPSAHRSRGSQVLPGEPRRHVAAGHRADRARAESVGSRTSALLRRRVPGVGS